MENSNSYMTISNLKIGVSAHNHCLTAKLKHDGIWKPYSLKNHNDKQKSSAKKTFKIKHVHTCNT